MPHFSESVLEEHPKNRVETRFADSQAFELLDEIAAKWREDTLDVLVLRAICRLSAKQPKRAAEGFTSLDVAEEVGVMRGRWSDLTDNDKVSADVRRQWNKLKAKTWPSKQEGVRQTFTDRDVPLAPALVKEEGGGAGRPSRYRVEWRPMTDIPPAPVARPRAGSAGDIAYICEDVEDAGLIAKAFARGFRVHGWRKALLVVFVAVPLMLALAMLAVILLGIALAPTLENAVTLRSLLSLGVVCVTIWLTIGPILEAPIQKIVLAPWWMQSLDSDRLLEHRGPPRFPARSMKAVRYTSICPTCEGKVTAAGGGMEFWFRIVGRCENAPKEHVFSFDHVTRAGKSLR